MPPNDVRGASFFFSFFLASWKPWRVIKMKADSNFKDEKELVISSKVVSDYRWLQCYASGSIGRWVPQLKPLENAPLGPEHWVFNTLKKYQTWYCNMYFIDSIRGWLFDKNRFENTPVFIGQWPIFLLLEKTPVNTNLSYFFRSCWVRSNTCSIINYRHNF